ncbi:ATP-dependent DNA ligase [Microlunatus sp. GCM10028923]|uniref:ATP-dependent DNA ligase n=1 Tax=Microlunatus sp. GCM10028923 TaxID=3273400 RepID=UPI003617EC7E
MELRPMLATLTDRLPAGPGWLFEPKWDGFRTIARVDEPGSASLFSRRGTNLNDAFPDVAAAAARALPAGTVIDGEIVRWAVDGRLDFEALQRRNRSAGRGARELARTEPCHLIAFDLLRTPDGDVTGRPLAERRALLESMLLAEPDPSDQVVLGMQTDELDTAEVWLEALAKVGVEGIVAKRAAGTYRPGARGWSKIKRYATTEVIIGGVTGPLDRPESLVVGRLHTSDGQLHLAGRTTDLSSSAAEQVAAVITPADDHPWPDVLPPSWHDREPRPYHRVQPDLVAEIRVDVATSNGAAGETGHWRHRLRHLRLRPDLTVDDVPRDLDLEA